MKSDIFVNIYDLVPFNSILYPKGMEDKLFVKLPNNIYGSKTPNNLIRSPDLTQK